tara:strand:+ start:25 stop:477 length:453 start_codon:yes stop_codon:yes gene_type:complete
MNHTEDFKARNSVDITETKCKEFLDAKGITWTQFGFDCRDTVSGRDFSKIDWRLRCKPDFMIFQKQPVLLECKGFRDELKLKVGDIKAYDWWTQFHPLSCFLYSTQTQEHYLVSYKALRATAVKCETGHYHDNKKEYYKIPLDIVRSFNY